MRTLTCLFLLSIAPTSLAQSIDVTAANRDYDVSAHGYDYDFDDGVGVIDSTSAIGTWQETPSVSLDDYYGNYVASALVVHDSVIGDSLISASLEAEGESSGSLTFSDGWAETEIAASFNATERVRYRFVVNAGTTDAGFAVATIQLSGSQGNLAYVRVWDGDADALDQSGWLQPGAYDVSALAEAVALNATALETSRTTIDIELEVFEAADYDLDGDVDRADWVAFKLAWLSGSLAADFDGDGDVDATDLAQFLVAVRS